ncbi:putative carbonic anhydrase-like protein 1 [Gigantopelta aegis]|uniref:putative carbonic anhydrase-like protein 1 n=1 Tax=Gigantopelta aegis TaxID=1735272 RepID=UPI001B88C37C|nr:putative carbonic anhydrase-like protein 1 [Gigantopelta aegis]
MKMSVHVLALILLALVGQTIPDQDPGASLPSWEYEGDLGPKFWGSLHPDWTLCESGKYQSPVDIKPRALLFDPSLRRIDIDAPKTVRGTLYNTGHDVTIVLDDVIDNAVNISDGPLMYRYRIVQIKFHFGHDDNWGSEHTIDGIPFTAEIQFMAYNTDIYTSLAEAVKSPYGVSVIAVFAELGEPVDEGFDNLAADIQKIQRQGQTSRVETLPFMSLMSNTNYYVTYEGSLTQPGCHETVTWILFNKPVYISKVLLHSLRSLYRWSGDRAAPLLSNIRPTKPLNNRSLRTNINFPDDTKSGLCGMTKSTFYQLNPSITF